MNADKLRQRRNLIAISVLLLVFDFAEVKVSKVSILGTELLVGNVQILVVCAWVLWAYFFLRYYQYWRLESEQRIRKAFSKQLVSYARKFTNAKPKRDSSGGHYDNYKITRTGWGNGPIRFRITILLKGNLKISHLLRYRSGSSRFGGSNQASLFYCKHLMQLTTFCHSFWQSALRFFLSIANQAFSYRESAAA